MKKVLSFCLAMLMLLTMAPFAFAEVIANGDTPITIAADTVTKIELEQYPTGELTDNDGNVSQCNLTVHTNASKTNSYLFSGDTRGSKLTHTIKFSAEEAGTYDIELVYAEADYLSKADIVLNGVTVPVFHTSQKISDTTADDGSTLYYFEKDFTAYKKVFRSDLPAGDNTLTITFPERTGTLAGSIAYAADYMAFTPVAQNTAISVSSSQTTSLEIENLNNHTTLAGDVAIHIPQNGLKQMDDNCIISGVAEKNFNNTPLKMTIPINVEKAGFYDVEAIMNKGESWLSSATLYSSARGKLLTSSGSKYLKETSTYKFGGQNTGIYGKRTYLPAGEQTLTLNIATRPAAAPGGIWFLADKITLTPVTFTTEETAVIPAAGGTVEHELFKDYINDEIPVIIYDATSAAGNTASNSSFVKFDTGSRDYDFYIDMPVTIEKTGFYNLSVITSSSGSANLFIDGVAITYINQQYIGSYDNSTYMGDYYCVKYFPGLQYNARVYLTAGLHYFTNKSERRAHQAYDVANIFDCVKMTPDSGSVVTVTESGTASIQMEDYKNYIEKDKESHLNTGYSIGTYPKGTVLSITEIPTKDGLYISIPITVEKDGKYNVELYSSLGTGTFVSFSEVRVDGKAVVYNKDAYVIEDLSKDANGNIDYLNNNYKMHRFGAYTDLTAGDHTITYYAQKRKNYNTGDKNQIEEVANGYYRVTNVVDRIDITKCTNTVSYSQEDSAATVTVYPEKAVSGTSIIALYNGKELVGHLIADVTDAALIQGTVNCIKKPDTAKVFVWADTDNAEPKMVPVVLTVQ